ncbi:hypothetical protein Bpfe_004011 [Biomphalaria pfeifferi]|uniref:Uncharacterized protein n=1 Tax=Biomphalaria pfeifferi TaxID=112525 RepID=A0AAD8C6R1_BIOPF|nr:hypothetical protein Bpfe_004011 [Biomphalaria pfeifferi]
MYVRSTIWSKRVVSNSAKQVNNGTGLLSNDQYDNSAMYTAVFSAAPVGRKSRVSLNSPFIERDEPCAAVHHTRMCRRKD